VATADARPAAATPACRPGSVRRTTTHDSLRPGGLPGPVDVLARGRDLRTSPDGGTDTVEAACVELQVSPREYAVASIRAQPSHPGLAALTGVRVAGGFRQAVADALPGERASRSVRFQLLDDLPTALLVSGYAVPWPECPAAVASAARLAGAPAEGLRGWVRDMFVGTTTCTHLNDTLRSLEDVAYLAGLVSGSPAAGRSALDGSRPGK